MTRLRFVGWMWGILLVAFCGFNIYHSTGMVHATRKPGRLYYGCICHGDSASTFVHVRVSGPDSLLPGQIGTYTVSIVKDSNIAAGFNVAAYRGVLSVGDSLEEQWLEEELTHTMPKFAGRNDTISWTFHYEAPEFAIFDTLYSTANSVDMSYDPTGDFWNFGDNFIVRVGNPTGVAGLWEPVPTYKLSQNYPNPFNPSTTISFFLPSPHFVTLKVYTILGEEVAALVNERKEGGRFVVNFDGSRLASGVYFYRLQAFTIDFQEGLRVRGQAENFFETKKMALV